MTYRSLATARMSMRRPQLPAPLSRRPRGPLVRAPAGVRQILWARSDQADPSRWMKVARVEASMDGVRLLAVGLARVTGVAVGWSALAAAGPSGGTYPDGSAIMFSA